MFTYGVNGGEAGGGRRVRRQLLDVAADRKLLLAPAHFRGTPACRIARSSDGYGFEWAPP